jgi:hypothetical protein
LGGQLVRARGSQLCAPVLLFTELESKGRARAQVELLYSVKLSSPTLFCGAKPTAGPHVATAN